MLTRDQIDQNVNWLLKNGSPPVQYLTHRYLLGTSARTRTMKALWTEVENSPVVVDLFSRQQPDGSWCCGGPWAFRPHYVPKNGYSAFTPKYVTTVWILSVLGDMGFDVRNQRVRRAAEYTLSFQWPNGMFSRFNVDQSTQADLKNQDAPNEPCTFSVYLLGLAKVGMARDRRVKRSLDLLVRLQREDGGWVGQRHKEEKNWTRSCPWVTHHAASALYHAGNPKYGGPLREALGFLVWHLSTKKDEQIRRFFYRGHNMVKELLMFSEKRVGVFERPVRVVLDWLSSLYDVDEGCFRYRGKPISKHNWREDGATPQVLKYRLYQLIEDDWLTYYATRIALNLNHPG